MRRFWLAAAVMAIATAAAAKQAPPEMKAFNQLCPAPKLLPVLAREYQACSARAATDCDKFVDDFRTLLPEYDCQRPFDASPSANYIVPAIWLAGDEALANYVKLLSRLKTKKARTLFASAEFRAILDGHLAELYSERSRAAERKLKGK